MSDIVAERWIVAPGPGQVVRGVTCVGARDDDRRAHVLRPAAPLGRSGLGDFLAGHRALRDKPAALPILHIRDDGVIVRAVPAGTLADLGRPLRGHEALALAGWLGPVVMLAAPLLGGQLHADDVALDAENIPRLAPRGAPGLEAASGASVAPEIRGGRAPDTRTALYGLGALLYELLVGESPGRNPTPPSKKARNLSPEVDRVVLGLLSSEGPKRQYSLPPQPKRPPVLRAETSATGEASGVAERASSRGARGTRASPYTPRTAGVNLDEPKYAVLVDPRSLSTKAAQKLTGWLHLPEGTVAEFARVGMPLPVACVEDPAEAEACRSFLDDLRVEGQTVKRGSSGAQWQVAIWLSLLGATAALAWLVAPRVVGVPAVVVAALALPAAVWWTAQQARQVDQSLELLRSFLDRTGGAGRTWSVQESAHSRSAPADQRSSRGRAKLRGAMRDALRERPAESESD